MITIEHLTKYYGDFAAVKDLSVEIEEGHVYGFLGPNGAGKSTTMNIMTGCLSATEGHVRIDGYDIFDEPEKAKKRIGYLPEQPPLYMNETPEEYLRFVGEAKGLRGEELKEQIMKVMEQTKIEDVARKRISSLSKGYRQRVGIAQALLGHPKVIILDEPTVGLDPIQIIEIRDLIRELGQNHTVIFSSHILSEVQTICDRILIIAKGRLIAFDEPENLEKKLLAPNEITITAQASPEAVREILSGVRGITEIREITEAKGITEIREITEIEGITETKESAETPGAAKAQANGEETGISSVQIRTDRENLYDLSREVFFAFADRRMALLEMTLKKANLEEIFLELTENTGGETETSSAENQVPKSPVSQNPGEKAAETGYSQAGNFGKYEKSEKADSSQERQKEGER